MILQNVDYVWPPAILSTNRAFYTYLKPIFWVRVIDGVLCDPKRFQRLQNAIRTSPDLIQSITHFTLPFEEEDLHNSEYIARYKALHDNFQHVIACTNLQLAIVSDLHAPNPLQAARLGNVTDLTLLGWIPGSFERLGPIEVSLSHFEAWIRHMPKLTGLYTGPHLDGVRICDLGNLPNTLRRLELLGFDTWNNLSIQDLQSILLSVPSLRHLVITEMDEPHTEVADTIEQYLPFGVSYFGVAFQPENGVPNGKNVIERPEWEEELAGMLTRPYVKLTFYLIVYLVVFVDVLAASPTSQSLTSLRIKTPDDSWPLLQGSDDACSSRSMHKLMDCSVFPKLASVTGNVFERQMQKLGQWPAYAGEAARSGIVLITDAYTDDE